MKGTPKKPCLGRHGFFPSAYSRLSVGPVWGIAAVSLSIWRLPTQFQRSCHIRLWLTQLQCCQYNPHRVRKEAEFTSNSKSRGPRASRGRDVGISHDGCEGYMSSRTSHTFRGLHLICHPPLTLSPSSSSSAISRPFDCLSNSSHQHEALLSGRSHRLGYHHNSCSNPQAAMSLPAW